MAKKILAAFAAALAMGCSKKELPSEVVGSYARGGDSPADVRAELSIARGGMVLTVVRMSASADLGVFGSLSGKGLIAGAARQGR